MSRNPKVWTPFPMDNIGAKNIAYYGNVSIAIVDPSSGEPTHGTVQTVLDIYGVNWSDGVFLYAHFPSLEDPSMAKLSIGKHLAVSVFHKEPLAYRKYKNALEVPLVSFWKSEIQANAPPAWVSNKSADIGYSMHWSTMNSIFVPEKYIPMHIFYDRRSGAFRFLCFTIDNKLYSQFCYNMRIMKSMEHTGAKTMANTSHACDGDLNATLERFALHDKELSQIVLGSSRKKTTTPSKSNKKRKTDK